MTDYLVVTGSMLSSEQEHRLREISAASKITNVTPIKAFENFLLFLREEYDLFALDELCLYRCQDSMEPSRIFYSDWPTHMVFSFDDESLIRMLKTLETYASFEKLKLQWYQFDNALRSLSENYVKSEGIDDAISSAFFSLHLDDLIWGEAVNLTRKIKTEIEKRKGENTLED